MTETLETLSQKFEAAVEQGLAERLSCEQLERMAQRAIVILAMRQCRGNQCRAARRLGIHRNTLSRMINLLEIGHLVKRSYVSYASIRKNQ